MKEKLILCKIKYMHDNLVVKLMIFYQNKMKKLEQDNNLIILVNRAIGLVLKNLVIDIFQKCKINLNIIKKIYLPFIPIFTEMMLNLRIQVKMNITISI